MPLQALLQQVLFLFGIGFGVANGRALADYLRFRTRRRTSLLVWPASRPRFYGFSLALGVMLGVLFGFKLLVQHRPLRQLFGEAMMFLYYGYLFPLTMRIQRGFYEDGVWSDSGFMRWAQISAVSWKEEPGVTLVLISRVRQIARRLRVPTELYGQARRVLRDRVKTDRKSTRLNSSHIPLSRMPSSA